MAKEDPLFPRTFLGRVRLAVESLFFFCVAIYSVSHWPPVPVAAQGVGADVFLAIVFELMIAMIPVALLGLWWAVATPEWIRTFLERVSHHAAIVVSLLVCFGLLGMVAGALGWW